MKTSVLPQRSGSDLSGLPAIIVFILLQPFYLWDSSLPQIGPLTFAVMFIGVFMSGGLVIHLDDKFQVRAVLYIALFAGWAFIVDGLYSVTEHTNRTGRRRSILRVRVARHSGVPDGHEPRRGDSGASDLLRFRFRRHHPGYDRGRRSWTLVLQPPGNELLR